jgi:hypothetical protein
MESGIKIHIGTSGKEIADRIELSSGTRVADVSETSGDNEPAAYEEGARLPREPWRRPTVQEAEHLISTKRPRNMANTIAIVRLRVAFTDELRDSIRNVSAETLEADLLEPLRKICELGEPVHCIGASENPPNLKTLTINRDINRFNGLHVDNWDGMDLSSRHLATNRICINIGKGDRYILFLPFSLMEIAALLAKKIGPTWEPSRRYSLIGRQFMERFPDVPVIRCRLSPGEAYIAPTENLVHDGSSLGQSEMDEHFTVRGHIRPL